MSRRKKCAMCDNEVQKYPLCQACLYETGKEYTAANFDLSGLSLAERQLVFLWACGQDISQYFEKHSVPLVEDNLDLVGALDKRLPPGISGFISDVSPRRGI